MDMLIRAFNFSPNQYLQVKDCGIKKTHESFSRFSIFCLNSKIIKNFVYHTHLLKERALSFNKFLTKNVFPCPVSSAITPSENTSFNFTENDLLSPPVPQKFNSSLTVELK